MRLKLGRRSLPRWLALGEYSEIESTEAMRCRSAEAIEVQAQLAYAERVIAPAVTAGDAVRAARSADMGWQDAEVQAMVAGLAQDASCSGTANALRGGLAAVGVADINRLMTVDREMRAALPIYGRANDAALCNVIAVDAANSEFLQTLSIADSGEVRQLLGEEPPQELAPAPHQLRIIARLGEDGRIEHGVELSSGEQILPEVRHLPADTPVDEWWVSSDVNVDETSIGHISSQRLADGRVALGFLGADGQSVTPGTRHLPADLPVGVWLRSGEIEVPAPASE